MSDGPSSIVGGGPARAVVAALAVTVAAALVALVWLWLVVTPWDEPVLPLLVFVPVPAVVWLLVSRAAVGRLIMAGVWVVVVAVMLATVGLSASGTVTRVRYEAPLDAMTVASLDLLAGADVPVESCGLPPLLDYGPLGAPVSACVVTYDIGISDGPAVTSAAYGAPVTNAKPVTDATRAGSSESDSSIPVRQVRYIWGSERAGTTRELVFEASVAQPPAGRCVRSVRTRWWAWMDNGSGCPRGFVSSSQ